MFDGTANRITQVVVMNARHHESEHRRSTASDYAAIILCGGESRRMGHPKHMLRYGQQTALERILHQLESLVNQVVVVGAVQQTIDVPLHMRKVAVTHDRVANQGPLEGLASGWLRLDRQATAVFVCSCDVPLLAAEVVIQLFRQLETWEAAVPIHGRTPCPLTAVYSAHALPVIHRLLGEGCRRMRDLVDRLSVRLISTHRFQQVDPDLLSFENVNSRVDYERVLAKWREVAHGPRHGDP